MAKVPLLLISVCIGASGAGAQARPGAGLENGLPKAYLCGRASGPVRIDGRLSDRAWQRASWTDAFVDIEGSLKAAPQHTTRVKMLWDDRFLYIGAMLEEPHVWGTLTRRDTVIFYDNDFEVFIDPDGDNHEYYELELNALNTVWDLFLPRPYRDGGKAVDAWDIAGLKTAVHVDGTLNDPRDTDRGWSAEIALPWKALGEYAHRPVPPREGESWRINFSRVEWDSEVIGGAYRKVAGRPEQNWVWSPQWVIDMHRPELWGILQFTTSAGRGKILPDPSFPARALLMSVYYAQVEYRKSHGAWATRIEETGLSAEHLAHVRYASEGEGWFAETTAGENLWRVWQDSRLERVR
jgi:hypothetical protein